MEKLITHSALVFYAIALAGILAHGVKRWATREIRGSLVDWYLMAPRRTVYAVTGALGGVAVALLTGTVVDWHDGAHVLAVWGMGYAADSGINGQGVR